MDAVFYLAFYKNDYFDKTEPVERSVGFYVANILQPWNEVANRVKNAVWGLEDMYGVHDYCTAGIGVNAIGYTSYQVKGGDRDELIEQWRQVFFKLCPGCEVSAVYELTHDPVNCAGKDAEILQFVKQAHERTQAQQLRAVLNTHISVVHSKDPVKKM